MDTSTLCTTGTWNKVDLLLPKLVCLNDAQQLFGEAGFGVKAADFLGKVLPSRYFAALGPSRFVLLCCWVRYCCGCALLGDVDSPAATTSTAVTSALLPCRGEFWGASREESQWVFKASTVSVYKSQVSLRLFSHWEVLHKTANPVFMLPPTHESLEIKIIYFQDNGRILNICQILDGINEHIMIKGSESYLQTM